MGVPSQTSPGPVEEQGCHAKPGEIFGPGDLEKARVAEVAVAQDHGRGVPLAAVGEEETRVQGRSSAARREPNVLELTGGADRLTDKDKDAAKPRSKTVRLIQVRRSGLSCSLAIRMVDHV
jgi:hypothetical protein